MKVVYSLELEEGKTVKTENLLIIGVKKAAGVEQNESRNIYQGFHRGTSERRV